MFRIAIIYYYAKINLQQPIATSTTAKTYSHGPIVWRRWNYVQCTY